MFYLVALKGQYVLFLKKIYVTIKQNGSTFLTHCNSKLYVHDCLNMQL